MGEGIADVLGFRTNSLYSIRGDDPEMVSTISTTPINEKLGVLFFSNEWEHRTGKCALSRVCIP